MPSDSPQANWLQSDPAAQLKTYTDQRMKGAWFRVIWSGALLIFFALNLSRRLEYAQKNDATGGFAVITALVLARFGYYLYRLIKAQRDVAEMKRSLGIMSPQ